MNLVPEAGFLRRRTSIGLNRDFRIGDRKAALLVDSVALLR